VQPTFAFLVRCHRPCIASLLAVCFSLLAIVLAFLTAVALTTAVVIAVRVGHFFDVFGDADLVVFVFGALAVPFLAAIVGIRIAIFSGEISLELEYLTGIIGRKRIAEIWTVLFE